MGEFMMVDKATFGSVEHRDSSCNDHHRGALRAAQWGDLRAVFLPIRVEEKLLRPQACAQTTPSPTSLKLRGVLNA